MTTDRSRRATTQSEPNRINHVFWRLADVEMGSVLRDPEWVVKTWLTAVDGLEGRRGDQQTAQNALSFLMRLEQDPFYASPEQTRGGEKDSSGLVYSLALLLFERLTGHHPFVESLSPLACRIQRDRATRVGKNNLCHLSSRLRVVLNKALSPFAEDRYQNLAALRADIECWQRGDMPTLGQDSHSAAVQSQRAATPLSRATQPPPTPRAAQRFVDCDTLQDAVAVRPANADASVQTSKTLAPWMWPSVSAGFALVATIALFVAFKSNTQNHGPNQIKGASAGQTSPVADSQDLVDEVLAFDEAEPTQAAVSSLSAEQQIVVVLRSCIAKGTFRGGLDVGLSLLFDDEGHVSRSFTGKLPIARREMACIKAAIDGIATEDTALLGKMMRYDLYLASETERVRAHPVH